MIYTIQDVKVACNTVLRNAFADDSIKIYGNDTLDGYTRPSFLRKYYLMVGEKIAHT